MKDKEEEQEQLKRVQRNLCILAQLTRNRFAFDYWTAHLSTVCELPIFRREVKQLYNRIMREATVFNGTFLEILSDLSDEVDVHEMMLDSTSEFHRDISRMVYLYEQAMSRVIQHHGLPYPEFMCRMSTAQQILNACAMAAGIEAGFRDDLRHVVALGAPCVELPRLDPDNTDYVVPSAIGHFYRLAGRMNLALLAAVGHPGDIKVTEKDDPEVMRSVDICSKNIIHAMMDYETISAMYTDHGHTIAEAREIVAKEKEKHLKREAKKQYKQTSKNKKQ